MMPQLPLFGTTTPPEQLTPIQIKRRNHEACRAELTTQADELLREIENWQELPDVKQSVTRMVVHPVDRIARRPLDDVTIEYFNVSDKPTMKMPVTGRAAHLVVYRVRVGRETGFAVFDQKECMYLRPRAFIDLLVPADSFDDPEVDQSYGDMKLLLRVIADRASNLTT